MSRPDGTTASAASQRGDVITFVRETEHLDFVGAVEHLAAKAGMQLTLHDAGQSAERRGASVSSRSMDHGGRAGTTTGCSRLPTHAAARDYLRSRGLAGDVARRFRLGWAPDDVGRAVRGARRRRRAAARHVGLGVHQPRQPACRTPSGRG